MDPAAWQQHGALLAAIDRLRVEIAAAARPADAPWRPAPLLDRQRQAVRRAFTGGTEQHPADEPAVVPPTAAPPDRDA